MHDKLFEEIVLRRSLTTRTPSIVLTLLTAVVTLVRIQCLLTFSQFLNGSSFLLSLLFLLMVIPDFPPHYVVRRITNQPFCSITFCPIPNVEELQFVPVSNFDLDYFDFVIVNEIIDFVPRQSTLVGITSASALSVAILLAFPITFRSLKRLKR